MSRAGTSLSIMAVVALIAVMAQHTRADVLLEEPFSTDVVGSGDWIASDASVSVDVANGWLRIGSDGAVDDFADKYGPFPLPLVIVWRERTFSGEGSYISLPKLEFWWGPSSANSYHITYVQDDQSGSPDDDGWLFGSWTNVHTLGPTDWSQWRTVKAIIRSDGGELFAKQDGDPDFTPLATSSWAIPNVIERFRLSQHSDDVSEFDFVRVTTADDPFCDDFDGEIPGSFPSGFSVGIQPGTSDQLAAGGPGGIQQISSSEWKSTPNSLRLLADGTYNILYAVFPRRNSGRITLSYATRLDGEPHNSYAVVLLDDQTDGLMVPGSGPPGYGIAFTGDWNGRQIGWQDGAWHNLGAYNLNEWYNVFLDIDLDSKSYDIYVDGVLFQSAALPNRPELVDGVQRLVFFHDNGTGFSSSVWFDDMCFDSSSVCPGGADGAVHGSVVADCSGQQHGLFGVRLDAFDETGHLVGTDVTDESGSYVIDALLVGQRYTITLVTPLGYTADPDELLVEIGCEGSVTADFVLSCTETTGEPRTIGFWKHQVGVATGGKGTAQIDAASLCGFLDLIEGHFNNNAINQVAVYNPPTSVLCDDKLAVAKELLNLKGNVGMTARARQQLMALLLNVAAGYAGLTSIVSSDGATLSQAITYSDQLIDSPDGDHEKAKTICDLINNNQIVTSGMIPLTTANIAYKTTGTRPRDYGLGPNYPNPFNAATVISFTLSTDSDVRLDVYDVLGRRVATLVDDLLPAGEHHVSWDAIGAASGIYFARLVTPEGMMTRKMVLVR